MDCDDSTFPNNKIPWAMLKLTNLRCVWVVVVQAQLELVVLPAISLSRTAKAFKLARSRPRDNVHCHFNCQDVCASVMLFSCCRLQVQLEVVLLRALDTDRRLSVANSKLEGGLTRDAYHAKLWSLTNLRELALDHNNFVGWIPRRRLLKLRATLTCVCTYDHRRHSLALFLQVVVSIGLCTAAGSILNLTLVLLDKTLPGGVLSELSPAASLRH